MKKHISILLILLFGMSQHINAEIISGSYNNNKLYWSFNDETGELIVSGVGDMPDHNIPWSNYSNQIKSVVISSGITGIGSWVFRLNESITSVTIPEGVTFIGDAAFFGCSSLTSVELPSSVTRIDNAAFGGCKFTSFTIPEGITSIPTNLFQGCSLLDSIKIPGNITSIGGSAFQGCGSLTSIEISEGVTSIGGSAFNGCSSLTSIEIPEGVTSIGGSAFQGCSSLKSINIPEGIKIIEGSTFNGCSSLTSIEIPEEVITIGGSAFQGCNSLTSIEIPEGVTSIGGSAFRGCSSLTSIEIPEEVITIGGSTFRECSSLASIVIPEAVTSIGEAAFCGCSSLTSIKIPEEVTSIEKETFADCVSLSSLIIPEGVTSIGYHTFWRCGLLNQLELPSTIQTIDNAFENSFAQLKCKATVPPSLASIGSLRVIKVSEGYTHTYRDKKPWNSAIIIDGSEADINVNITTPGTLAENILKQMDYLRNVYHLTISGSLNDVDLGHIKNSLPNLLTIDMENTDIEEIPNGLCQDKPLLNVLLPRDLKKIGDHAFQNCSLLDSIIIPDNVTEIWMECFRNCSSLKYIRFPQYVNIIDYCAFFDCHSLEEVRLSDGLVQLGHKAFGNCSRLKKVYIPANVKIWHGKHVVNQGYQFDNCSKLTEVVLAEGLKTLGERAFNNCTSLKEITLPSTLESCENNPFTGCSQLTKINSMSIFPPVISSIFTTSDWNADITRSLYVPKWVVNQYKQANGWASFHEILPLENVYPTSIYVTNSQTLTLSANDFPNDYEPDLIINKGNNNGTYGNLHLKGEGTIPLNKFEIDYTYENYSPAFVNDVAVTANSVVTHLHTEKGQWAFLSFPYDIKVADVITDGDWVIRYHDGEAHARINHANTWVTMPYDSILHAGEGYIWSCSDGILSVPALNNNKTNLQFSNETHYTPLKEHISTNTANSNWNLIGNPYPCYYDIRFLEYTAPITVWNRSNRTYSAYSPTDDDYILRPFEAFFVQRPIGVASIGFTPDGRQTNTEVRTLTKEASIAYTRGSQASRQIFNIALSDKNYTDRTRFVINESALIGYEMNCDASKFMSTETQIPQLFTIEGKDNYAINERPLADGNIKLGVYAGNAGCYTISLETESSIPILLIDHQTGTEVEISNQSYTFETEAGIIDERFSLSIGNTTAVNDIATNYPIKVTSTPNGITVTNENNTEVTLYNVAGVRIATAYGTSVKFNVVPGFYLVKVNNVSYKISVVK